MFYVPKWRVRLRPAVLVIVVMVMIAALFATATAGAATSQAADRTKADLHALVPLYRATVPIRQAEGFRDSIVHHPLQRSFFSAASAPSGFWGGAYTDSAGEPVTIYVSTWFVQNDPLTQAIADFMGSLVHGAELPRVTILIGPYFAVQSVCGAAADSCYDPAGSAIYVPGDGANPDGLPLAQLLEHEYGHHVANNRSNPPWAAVDWGTKRWASYEDVCAKQGAGLAFPGDEATNYWSNPGEAFADSYMYLNNQRLGHALPPWVFNVTFMPDYAALSAIQQDVTSPWTGQKTFVWRGRVTRARSSTLPTTLDGNVAFRLAAPAGSTLQIYAEGQLVASTHRNFAGTICGARSIVTRVISRRAGGFLVTAYIP
jgi:hypothetical protein